MERRIVYENFAMNNPILRNTSDEIYEKKMEEIRHRENKFIKMSPITRAFRKISPQNRDLMYLHKVQKDNEYLENKIKKIIEHKSVIFCRNKNFLVECDKIEFFKISFDF
jgi:hypothetical protein